MKQIVTVSNSTRTGKVCLCIFPFTCWTGHNFHKVVWRLPSLEFLHQVLDVAEAVCGSKGQQDNSVFL